MKYAVVYLNWVFGDGAVYGGPETIAEIAALARKQFAAEQMYAALEAIVAANFVLSSYEESPLWYAEEKAALELAESALAKARGEK